MLWQPGSTQNDEKYQAEHQGPRRYLIWLIFVTMLSGGFSLDRIIPGISGPLVTVRYWGFYVLAIIMGVQRDRWVSLGHAQRRWLLLVTYLHLYLLFTALWAPNPVDSLGKLPDVLLLIILLLMSAFIFCQSPESSIQLLLKAFYWVSLVFMIIGILIYRSIVGGVYVLGVGGIGFSHLQGMGILAAIYLWTKTGRTYWLAPIPVSFLSMLLSGSRTSVLALAVGLTTLILLVVRTVPNIISFSGVFLVLVLSLWFFARIDLELFWKINWVGGYHQLGFKNIYLADRDLLGSAAWHIFLEHPFLGTGFGGYEQITGYFYPHNLVLNIVADGGIVGLALFCIPLFLLVGRWFRSRMLEHNMSFCAGMFYLVFSMFVGTYYDAKFMWLFFLLYMMPATDNKIRAGD